MMKWLLGFPPMLFVKDVAVRILLVTPVAVSVPLAIIYLIPEESFFRFILTVSVSVLMNSASVYFLGLSRHERSVIKQKLKSRFKIIRRNVI